MPPWFIEKNIGIQRFKDDISLTDDEIATFAAWADASAPRGNPADMPPPIKWADANEWTIGTPDLIVSTPVMTMPAVGADYHDEFGPVPAGLLEDRYIKAVEVKEVRLLDADTKARLREKVQSGSGYGRFTIHHLGIHTGDLYYESEEGRAQFRFTHEIGQNATFYPNDVGVILPAGSQFRFTTHLFAAGEPVQVRADVGFKFHPKGYKPKYENWEFGSIAGGTLIDIPGGEDNVRLDGFYIMPKDGLLNTFEPHMHASGRRMCLEAIYPAEENSRRNRSEMLNCAKYRPQLGEGIRLRRRRRTAAAQGHRPSSHGLVRQHVEESECRRPAELEGARRALGRRYVHILVEIHVPDRRAVQGARGHARGEAPDQSD